MHHSTALELTAIGHRVFNQRLYNEIHHLEKQIRNAVKLYQTFFFTTCLFSVQHFWLLDVDLLTVKEFITAAITAAISRVYLL